MTAPNAAFDVEGLNAREADTTATFISWKLHIHNHPVFTNRTSKEHNPWIIGFVAHRRFVYFASTTNGLGC